MQSHPVLLLINGFLQEFFSIVTWELSPQICIWTTANLFQILEQYFRLTYRVGRSNLLGILVMSWEDRDLAFVFNCILLQAFVGALANKCRLQCLNVRENELEDSGAKCLAEALSTLQNLESVDFCGNQVALSMIRTVQKSLSMMYLTDLIGNTLFLFLAQDLQDKIWLTVLFHIYFCIHSQHNITVSLKGQPYD